MAVPYLKTEDGYEVQFGTNHMGPALFTKLLLPTLLKTAEEPGSDVRVIDLSSEAHQVSPWSGIVYDQEALENYNTWLRYGQSKLATILHVREMQRRYPSITSTSLHPGIIATDLWTSANSNPVMRIGMSVMKWFLMDVHGGAKNSLWATTAPKEEVRSGYYWTPVGKKSGGSFWGARKEQLAKDLWVYTEKEFERQGY